MASGNAVIFAGAGISTENPVNSQSTFYEEITHELKADGDISFPDLMTLFCQQPDGRIKLVEKIKKRIEYFRSFRGFYAPMTAFHRALRPLFMLEDVITTNWDDFFEAEAGYQPFVYDQDFAFIGSTPKKVVKIHGSISNFGSIVATASDYRKSLSRLNSGPLGAYLKHTISTKTIVYVGYSLRDANYLNIARSISRNMGEFGRTCYFVSPQIDKSHLESTSLNLVPLETDGAHFLEEFRRIYRDRGNVPAILDDKNFDACDELLHNINSLHLDTANEFQARPNPALILALSYQDGLQDALMRIKDLRYSGEYYNGERVHNLVHGYDDKVRKYKREKNLWDACYCRGYMNGMIFLLSGGDRGYPPPVEVIFDANVDTVAKLRRLPKRRLPAYAKKQLDRIFERCGKGALVPEHMPYV